MNKANQLKRTTIMIPADLYRDIRRMLADRGDSNVSRFLVQAAREKMEREKG